MKTRKHEHNHLPSKMKTVRTDEGIFTIVLHHCKCGDLLQSRIPGEWTWDEIAPSQTKKPRQSDKQFLQSIGIAAK